MARVSVRFDGVSSGARRAATETRAAVKGVGDQADRESKRLNLLGPALRRTMQLAAVGLTVTAAAAVVGLKKSVAAASNLTEQINKARVVFRGAEKEVIEWSKTTADSIGISQRAALEFAGTFGNMLVPMGFARKEAAQMSVGLVKLAADMASFNNASPEETLEALRSGLAGETEPLRRFGVFLSEARIQQMALNEGLVSGKEKLTAAGKAAAVYRIILKDTGDAQGDFARTSDEVANAERRKNANLEQTAATIGKVFLPAWKSALKAVNDWLADPRTQQMLEDLAETLRDKVAVALRGIAEFISDHRDGIVNFFRETADFAGDAAKVIGTIVTAADRVARAVGGWGDVFKFTAILVGLQKLRTSMALLIGVEAAAGGTGILGAAGGAALLRTRLLALARMGPIVIPLSIAWVGKETGFNEWLYENFLRPTTKFWTGGKFDPGSFEPEPKQGIGGLGGVGAPGAARGAGGLAVPTSIVAPEKHPGGTTGLAGFPATDIFANAGTKVLAPENGSITRTTGGPPELTAAAFKGFSLYFVGESGNTYFITHLASVAARGRYRKGDVIATLAAGTAGGPHAHVGIHKGPAAAAILPSTSTPPGEGLASPREGAADSGLEPSATTAVTSTPGTAGAAKAGIDPRDLRAARGSAAFINKRLESIASPAVRAALRQRGLAIANVLADITDPKEFARARRNLNALERDYKKAVELNSAVKQAQQTARSIATALGRMPEALQADLRPKLEKLNRSLGNVTSKRQLDRIKAGLEEINAAVKAALEKMQQTVDRRRDAFGAAFGRLADKALSVFDAKTAALIAAAAAKSADLDARLREATPAERELAAFREGRTAGQRAAEDAALVAEAARLEAEVVGESEEEKTKRLAELADVRGRIRERELDASERALEERAQIERAALEAEVELERRAREAAAEAAQRQIADERAMLRERFQGRYDAIVLAFQQEEITAEEAQRRMLALLADPEYAADFAEAGALIGEAFARSFTSALAAVDAAVRALRESINDLARAAGTPYTTGQETGDDPIFDLSQRVDRNARLTAGRLQRAGFAHGGRVPGRYVGRADTVAAMLTPGETVIDRSLTQALERALAGGGLGGPVYAVFNVDGQRFAQAVAQPMSDEQARIISYSHQAT